MAGDMNAVLGKLVADELKKMQGEDANFNPRGEAAAEVDSVTAEILQNMKGGNPTDQRKAGLPPEVAKDFDWINGALLANPLIIPYVAQHLDEVLQRFNTSLHAMMRNAFDYRPEDAPVTPQRPTPEPAAPQPVQPDQPDQQAPAPTQPVTPPARDDGRGNTR